MEHLEFAPMNQDVRWPLPEGWPDVSFRQLSCGQWECKVKDGDMIGVGYGDSEVDAWKDAGSPELSRADLTIYPTECEDKFNNVMNFGTLEPMRLPDSWKGLEITHLENGGYYFAPPGDFSKVDFSACHELGESVNLDATLNRMGFTPFDAGRYAKPALPSLMTEAGERYQGLGWCDE